MEDRGRNSRTYKNRKRTYGKSGRPASQSRNRRPSGQTHPRRRPTGENFGGAGAYETKTKKTTHDPVCPVNHINHCSNCRNHLYGNVTAHQKNNMI